MSYGPQPPGTGPNQPMRPPAYPHPGGYGPPQEHAGPAWYGQPQPPAYPGGGPPAKKTSKRGVVIAVVAVVLAAAAGGGAWFWLSSESTAADAGFAPQADTQLSMMLEERFPEDWKPDASTTKTSVGSWLDGRWWTEQHLVREMWNEVVAYDLADGSVAWRVPVPGNGACRASRDASPEGYVAIMRGEPFENKGGAKPCDQLTLVDINAGKEVWTVKVEPDGPSPHTVANRPVIWGGYVFVATRSAGFRYGIADGAPAGRGSGGCGATDYVTSGDTLMIWGKCESGWVLVGYGPDLEVRWAWEYPEDKARLAVLSADPLIVIVKSRYDQQVWRVEPGGPDDPGEHTVLVEMDERSLAPKPPCGHSGAGIALLAQCTDVVLGDGVLYLKYAMDPDYDQMGIVALDLESGEERWRARGNGELSLQPVGVAEDGRLIAFQPQLLEPGKDGGTRAAVVAVDPDTGSSTPVAGLPLAEAGLKWLLSNNSLDGDIEWRDGRLAIVIPEVIVTDRASGGGPGSVATVIYS